MEQGRLQYYSKPDYWRIVDNEGNLYEPNPFYTIIEIKLNSGYRHCSIKRTLEGGNQEQGWYVKFWDTSFALDKSISYDIKYHIDEDLMIPF